MKYLMHDGDEIKVPDAWKLLVILKIENSMPLSSRPLVKVAAEINPQPPHL